HVVARQSIFGRVVGDDSVAVKFKHPMVSSDPEIARAVRSDRPRRRARDRFRQVFQLPIFIPEQSGDRPDPQTLGAVFPQSLDNPFGFDPRVVLESSVSELAQTLDRTDPDMAVASLQQGIDFAVRQAAFSRVGRDELFSQTIKPAFRPDPDRALTIFEDGADVNLGEPGVASVEGEPSIFETSRPNALQEDQTRGKPEAAIIVFTLRAQDH